MTLFDPHPAVIGDLSTQFYLTESDIGQPRDQVTRSKLAELNNYVPIYVASDLKSLEQYKVIVLTESTIEEELEINEQARKYGNAFISAKVRGLFASAFCDFGKDFVCVDPTGEEPVRGSIGSISPNLFHPLLLVISSSPPLMTLTSRTCLLFRKAPTCKGPLQTQREQPKVGLMLKQCPIMKIPIIPVLALFTVMAMVQTQMLLNTPQLLLGDPTGSDAQLRD